VGAFASQSERFCRYEVIIPLPLYIGWHTNTENAGVFGYHAEYIDVFSGDAGGRFHDPRNIEVDHSQPMQAHRGVA
jgi:hypothetical protein